MGAGSVSFKVINMASNTRWRCGWAGDVSLHDKLMIVWSDRNLKWRPARGRRWESLIDVQLWVAGSSATPSHPRHRTTGPAIHCRTVHCCPAEFIVSWSPCKTFKFRCTDPAWLSSIINFLHKSLASLARLCSDISSIKWYTRRVSTSGCFVMAGNNLAFLINSFWFSGF